jgi:hypothetical protein
MSNLVLVSMDVLIHSFPHVGEAIHRWGDCEGERPYEHPHADVFVMSKNHDLYLLSKRELVEPKVVFRKFNLLDIADMMTVFTSAWGPDETLR